jgi:hypothetical protein
VSAVRLCRGRETRHRPRHRVGQQRWRG